MSLQEAQEAILTAYRMRIEELHSELKTLSGPQNTDSIKQLIKQVERQFPIAIPSSYLYTEQDTTLETKRRGAYIQKYQSCIETLWELCDQAVLVSSNRLRVTFAEANAKPIVSRKPRTPRAS